MSIYICLSDLFLQSGIHAHMLIQAKALSGRVIRCDIKRNESSIGGERQLLASHVCLQSTNTHLITHTRTLG